MASLEGALLRAWRRRTGRTLEEAARDLGVSRRMLGYYESGESAVPMPVLLAARALENGLGPLQAPQRASRERWVALVEDMKRYAQGEPVVGQLLKGREYRRLQEFLNMVRGGPDPDLALTDPALYMTLRRACTRAHLAGLSKYRLAATALAHEPGVDRQADVSRDGTATANPEADEASPSPRM
ncbi:MAG: helix-turn-helix transcriptional regulator [Acetobacteraceae bacterium]|nr:helix-turn-helix transcriptional regulator [Acetobacteraceae bacterium]